MGPQRFVTLRFVALRFIAASSVAASLFTAAAAFADENNGPIITDRPTDGTGPLVLAPGRLQLESGYRVAETDRRGGSAYSHLAPDLLIRKGLSERLELRAYVPGWVQETGNGSASGFSDITIGTKIHLADEDGLRPQSGVLIEAALPTGSNDVTADYVIPKALFLGTHTLNNVWSVTYNLGPSFITKRIDGNRDERIEWNYAIGAAGALEGGVTVFAEVFGAAVDDGRFNDRRSLQVGATWLRNNRLQFDARIGGGLIDSDPDWFLGFGVSVFLDD